MNYTTIEVKTENGTGWIVFSRPQVKNAFSVRTFSEVHEALEQLTQDDAVRTIVLMGKGGNFSSGRDFKDPEEVPPDFEERRSQVFNALEYCPKPTIAAVAGYAITGGLTMALSCDLIIAAEDAILQDTHAKIGAITLRASRLYEALGPLRAKEVLFTCRRVTASDALAMGLVNKVVPNDELERAASAMAAEINRHDPAVIAAIKKVINKVIRYDQLRMLDLEEFEKRRFNDRVPEQKAMAQGRDGIAK